ncbi:GCN5-related N-acetyltransferase [Neoconidiobolus thromboides FSU 785]|nr:GCN5-related N-acetyltransferase [Neoconidiobolus thromboides FSU 785]
MIECIPYDDKYKSEFKRLNLKWVEELFEVEESDIKQLDHPEDIINNGGQIFFLLDNSKVIGTVAMMKHEGEYELSKLAVEDGYKGQGLSKKLMDAAVNWVKEKGSKSILIICNTKLEPAITLYKKYGFETIHLGQHPSYSRANIVMRKTL